VELLRSMTFSILEKDDDLYAFITTNKVVYAKEVHATWDPKHKKHKLFKIKQYN
jgi:hypothetical protein